jgi:hypothetical protein
LRKEKILLCLSAVVFAFFIIGCNLIPDEGSNMSADGIVIYTGREILNDRTVEIVTNRVQRLFVTVPSGHKVEWISDNPDFITVNQYGVIRTSRTPNREVVIRAVSTVDPAIHAQVTFRTRGLR